MIPLVLLALFAAEPEKSADPPQPDQWYCSAIATGANGASIDAHIMLEADGKVVDQGAAWTPPRLQGGCSAKGMSPPAPDISIGYYQAGAEGLGPPTNVLISAVTLGRARLSRQAVGVLTLDGGPALTASLDVLPWMKTPDGHTFHSAFVEGEGLPAALERAGVAEVAVRGGGGKVLASSRFDLSARAERDRLFRQAWIEVGQAARTPEKCQKAVAPPPELRVMVY